MLAFEAPHRRPRIYAALVMYPIQQDPRCIHGEMAFGRCRNRAEVDLVRKAVTEIMKQVIETHRLPVDALWNRETN